MDDYEIYKRSSKYSNPNDRKSRYTRSAPTSVALEPIVVFGSNRVSTASSYKSAKSMTDSMRQNKKFPKLSTIASLSHSQSEVTSQSQQQNPSNFQPIPPATQPPPLSTVLTPEKKNKNSSSSLTSPSLSHRSYTPSSQYSSISKPPKPPQPPPLPLQQLQQQQQQQQQQNQQQQNQSFQNPQYPFNNNNPYSQQQQPYYPQFQPPNNNNIIIPNPSYPLQSPQYPLQSPNYPQNLYPPQQQFQQIPYLYPQQQSFQPPFQQQPPPPQYPQPIYYPPPKQNNSTICVPQSEVPDKIIYREIQNEERPLSPRQYFIYRNGCALKIMKWYRKQKQIKKERRLMKIADDVSISSSSSVYNSQRYEDEFHIYNEMVIRQADQFLINQQTRKNRSLLGILTKEIYEEDLNEFLKEIIIETIHEEVSEYFSRHDVVYNKRIGEPPIFDIDPERIEIRSLIREGILDRLISHGLLNKLSKDTNSEDNFYDLP